jgi:hypothetical protein
MDKSPSAPRGHSLPGSSRWPVGTLGYVRVAQLVEHAAVARGIGVRTSACTPGKHVASPAWIGSQSSRRSKSVAQLVEQ